MTTETAAARASLRTPRAAAVAGILFSVLLGLALLLIRAAAPTGQADASSFLSDPRRREMIGFALNLVPFAGIAFLWFIGVIRDRIGDREDRFFATVFLGSGLLFVAMLFVGAAVAGGLIADAGAALNEGQSPATWGFGQHITFTLLNVYAMRMGGVFIATTASLGIRTQVIPRWLGISGYASALILLFGVPLSSWLALLMPIWVLILSLYLLASGLKQEESPA